MPDKFADWRWQTLGNVTRDLERMESAVGTALDTIYEESDLVTRDCVTARAFLRAVRDPEFWDRARGLRKFIAPIRKLSGWAKGCDCHEQELLQGKVIKCVWKRCRAPSFANRIRQLEDELSDLRTQAVEGHIPGMSSRDTIHCLTQLLAFVRLKFQWVHEAPYTVWQLDSPRMALDFLDTHDALVAAGVEAPHRVVSHFAGASSPLRADMEAHAAGDGLSEALRIEIASYQFCTLDDTWVEAAHRDISGVLKKATNINTSTALASVRMEQSLDFLDSLAEDTQALFYRVCLPQWKSIAHPPCLVQPGRNRSCYHMLPQQVLTQFYRLGAESQCNWSARIQDAVSAISAKTRGRGDLGTQLKADFLGVVMDAKPGQIYSVPKVNAECVARARGMEASADVLASLEAASEGQREFIQVVVNNVRRKKQVITSTTQRISEFYLPALVQNFTQLPSQESAAVVAYPTGSPDLVDLLCAAEWATLRQGLRVWNSEQCDIHGVCLVDRGPLGQRHQVELAGWASASTCVVGDFARIGLA